jgi:hypothetical protein
MQQRVREQRRRSLEVFFDERVVGGAADPGVPVAQVQVVVQQLLVSVPTSSDTGMTRRGSIPAAAV